MRNIIIVLVWVFFWTVLFLLVDLQGGKMFGNANCENEGIVKSTCTGHADCPDRAAEQSNAAWQDACEATEYDNDGTGTTGTCHFNSCDWLGERLMNALWWTAITFLQVGYGDYSPRSATIKILNCIYIFGNYILFTGAITLFFKYIAKTKARTDHREKREINSHLRRMATSSPSADSASSSQSGISRE